VVKLGADHDPGDPEAALARTREWGDRLPIGVLYRANPRPTFGSRFREEISDRPLAELPPLGAEAIEEIFAGFRP
jgi:2-oxoglutarate ferredoxin oxidoreductase subunit beta